jgi:hypothetical protein
MSLIRRIAKYSYLCFMSLGALVAVLGIFSAITTLGEKRDYPDAQWWDHPVLSSGGTGIVLFLMTVTFFAIFVHRGTHLFAPLAYIASYGANAFGFINLFIDIEKRGAPGPRLTMAHACVEAAIGLGPALVVTAACLIWNYRAASRTCAL